MATSRPVVLRRSAPESGPAHVAQVAWVERRLTVDDTVLDAVPYVPGASAAELAGADGLPAAWVPELADGLLRVAQVLSAGGGGLGELSLAHVRVSPEGAVWLTRASTGAEPDGVRAIGDVLLDAVHAPDGPLGTWCEACAGGRFATAAEARAALASAAAESGHAPGALAAWALEHLPGRAPSVVAHPWAGRVVGVVSATGTPEAPPRARVAAIAALTLALGLAAGWTLASPPDPPAASEVHGEL